MMSTFRICSRTQNFKLLVSKSFFAPLSSAATASTANSLTKFQKLPAGAVPSPAAVFMCGNRVQFYSRSTINYDKVDDRAELERKISAKLTNWDPRTTNNGKPSKIYEGMLNSQIKSCKYISFTTTVLGIAMQPLIYQKIGDENLGLLIAVCGIVGIFTYITPFLIHWLAKRYVTELIYDPKDDSYTAATYSFFLRRNELKFKLEDITVPEIPGLFTTIIVKNADGKKLPLFLADVSFIEPKHFGRFMGYDKPIDFQLSSDDLNMAIEAKKKAKSQT